MKMFKLLLCALSLFFFVGCGSSINVDTKTKKISKLLPKKPKINYKFKKQPNRLYFNILQLNDVCEIAPIQGGKFGGMARVETVRKELLKETPNTMIVLAGGFLNPSLLGALKIDGERVKGRQMVEVMNAMNFDLVAFGNNDFDIGYKQLQNRLNESDFDWVSANVFHNRNGRAHYFYKIKRGRKETTHDSYIKEFYDGQNSVKVGFISVCNPSNLKDYVTYSDMYIEAERSYNEVKSQSDIVLGLTHLGINQDKQVAQMLPEIPLIMGGYEHTNSFDSVGRVKIAKADANAKTVYIHRFEYSPLTKELNLKSELRTIDESIPKDAEVQKIVEKWQNILQSKVRRIVYNPNEIVYEAVTPLEVRNITTRSKQTNMGAIIAKSMSYAYQDSIDCAFINSGSIQIDEQLLGNVTAMDIFRVLPYEGQIFKINIRGNLLKKVLEFGEDSKGKGAYLQRYNCNRIGEEWYVDNQPIDDIKTYRVAVSDYLMKGFDIPILKEGVLDVLTVYKPNSNEFAYDIRKAVIEYLKNK